ncbi:MAG: hypothetical protein PHP42_03195 [Bacteroidota bacterium]|nr:hypothetical protein [Bacteroidota bacterium]
MTDPKENVQMPASERLKEVALLLKQADKLVKEGDLASALELIEKARSFDSRHLYALAYEERVRTLLSAKQKAQQEKNTSTVTPSPDAAPPAAEQKIGPVLQHLSNLAIIEAQHSASVAAQKEQAIELQKKDEEEKVTQEELRRTAIESRIATLLSRATSYVERKEFNRAMDEISRACLLDPSNEEIHQLEERIRKMMEERKRTDEEDRVVKLEEERLKREEVLKSKTELIQKEKEENLKREEEERKFAQQEKVQQYIKRVNELYQTNKLEEALSELSFVVVIDPLNEEVLKLEQRILEMQERQQMAQMELYQKQIEERQKKREAILATIQKHIGNAELLAKQLKFTEALRTITRATVLDPVNEDLQQSENRILALQERYLQQEEERKKELQDQMRRQQEEELMRLEYADRERVLRGESQDSVAKIRAGKEKIAKYLSRAKQLLEEHHFEVALGELALAFIVNPFDEDIKKMEHEILTAREAYQQRTQHSMQKVLQEELSAKNDIDAQTTRHLQEAERLRVQQQYNKAFNEVAKAFILDPLNVKIQQYEQDLQEEFDRFLADHHKKKEQEEKTSIIRRHVDLAEEFLKRELFEQALSEVVAALAIDGTNSDALLLKDKIAKTSHQWTKLHAAEAGNLEVQKHLVTARELFTVGNVTEALAVVQQALALDPQKPEALSLQADIETIIAQSHQTQQLEQKVERVKNHFAHAQSYLMSNLLDKAMVEILSGLVLDPSHPELLALEQRVTALHDTNITAHQSSTISSPAPKAMSAEEQVHLVRIHVRVASEFRSQREYAKALDEIAHGFSVDPFNSELLALDGEIRKEQKEYDQKSSQGLKLIYSGGKGA